MPFFDMSGLVLKSAFSKPSTRKFPFVIRKNFPLTRGNISIEIEKCIHCSICAKRCPTDALTVTKDPEKTWSIDRMKCCQCTYCVEVCPKKCLHNETDFSAAGTDRKGSIEVFKNA
jgi:ech hydrogenase subunit F